MFRDGLTSAKRPTMRSIISAATTSIATSITTSLVLPVHFHITYRTIVEYTMVIKQGTYFRFEQKPAEGSKKLILVLSAIKRAN